MNYQSNLYKSGQPFFSLFLNSLHVLSLVQENILDYASLDRNVCIRYQAFM